MREILFASLAATALISALAVSAQALTPRPIVKDDGVSMVTRVADGCGWHRHYSRRLGHCVHD